MTTNTTPRGRYAPIHGLELYYEIHGSGQPLVLLPGAYQTIAAMGPIVPELAATRRVIGVELQGHGHTADIDRPLRYELLADDVAALIEYLQLERADLFGYSLGGGVALQTAIRHPEAVRKVVLASTAFRLDGWYPDVIAAIRATGVEDFARTSLPDEYRAISPRPEAWPTVIAKTRDMVTSNYDWADEVAALKAPVLLVVGDGDGVHLEHVVEFFGLLGGGKGDGDMRGPLPSALAVLPATTHVGWAPPYHGIMNRTQLIVPIITEFLAAPMGSGAVSDRPNDVRA